MTDGMTDDDRDLLNRSARKGNPYARAVLAEAARTDDLAATVDAQGDRLDLLEEWAARLDGPPGMNAALRVETLEARLDEALTLLADWLDHYSPDWNRADALRGLVKNAGGGEDRPTEAERPVPSGSPAPERYECSDGVTREASDEVRPPRKGEWFAHSYNDGTAVLAREDFGADRRILRPVQDPAPDWEARARKAEAEVARLRDGIDDEAAYLANSEGLNYQAIARRLRALLDPPGADQ